MKPLSARFAAGALALLGIVCSVPMVWEDAAALEPVPVFGDNPGQLDMFVYVPPGASGPLPLVVALHGCGQQAADFDTETGLVALADTAPFVLLLPQQRIANNALRCFNWFEREDSRPGRGESASIRNMIDHAVAAYSLDPDGVHVLGLSAGGAMTTVLVANYPDRIAGGAVVAGVPFDCNRPIGFFGGWWFLLNVVVGDAASASYACGLAGSSAIDRAASEWGRLVRNVAGPAPARWPPMSLWHGTADTFVDPANLRELVQQWTSVHGIDAVPDDTETVAAAVREVFRDDDGVARVEAWRIADFPHAMPIDPGEGPGGCGTPDPATDNPVRVDADICAVRRIAAFWGLIP